MLKIIDFINSHFSGISSFSKSIAENSNKIVYVGPQTGFKNINLKNDSVIINFPSMTIKHLHYAIKLAYYRILGLDIRVIVHEYYSQSYFGKGLLIFLIVLSKKTYLVSPFLSEVGIIMFFSREVEVVVQGCNFMGAKTISLKDEGTKLEVGEETRLRFCINGSLSNFSRIDLNELLGALICLNNNGLNFSLMFLGSKSELSEFPHLFESRFAVYNLNNLTEHDYVSKLSSCDLCFLPFRDGITMRRSSLISSLFCGLKIITTPPQFESESNFIRSHDFVGITYSSYKKNDLICRIRDALDCSGNCTPKKIRNSAIRIFNYEKYANKLIHDVYL